MGSNAALLAGKVIDNTAQVLAVQFIAIAQAVDYLNCQDLLSNKTLEIYHLVRHYIDAFIEDSPQFERIAEVKEFLLNSEWADSSISDQLV
jgi:histidine ammonia-lyase